MSFVIMIDFIQGKTMIKHYDENINNIKKVISRLSTE